MIIHPRRHDQPTDHQDLEEMLPPPGRPVLAQDRQRVLREHLMAHITTSPPPSGPARRTPSPRLPNAAVPGGAPCPSRHRWRWPPWWAWARWRSTARGTAGTNQP